MQDVIIDFMRHGEPVGGRRFRGDGIDDSLSEKGWEQMWRSVGEYSGWDCIISSPMQRCSAFAEALAERLRVPFFIDPGVREVNMGTWEGKSPDDIIREDPDAYAAYYRDPQTNRPAGCEPLDEFGKRVSDAYRSLVSNHAGERLLVIAHAGVIRATLGYVLQADPVAWYRTRVDNAGITRFRHGVHGDKLEYHNSPSIID